MPMYCCISHEYGRSLGYQRKQTPHEADIRGELRHELRFNESFVVESNIVTPLFFYERMMWAHDVTELDGGAPSSVRSWSPLKVSRGGVARQCYHEVC